MKNMTRIAGALMLAGVTAALASCGGEGSEGDANKPEPKVESTPRSVFEAGKKAFLANDYKTFYELIAPDARET